MNKLESGGQTKLRGDKTSIGKKRISNENESLIFVLKQQEPLGKQVMREEKNEDRWLVKSQINFCLVVDAIKLFLEEIWKIEISIKKQAILKTINSF